MSAETCCRVRVALLTSILVMAQARRIQQKGQFNTDLRLLLAGRGQDVAALKPSKALAMLVHKLNLASAFAHPGRQASRIGLGSSRSSRSCLRTRLHHRIPVMTAPPAGTDVLDQQVEARPAKVLPCGDSLDKQILQIAFPAMLNYLVLPFTGLIDLFFIGRLGETLAVAGQSAADRIYSTSNLLNVIPTVTQPLVGKAHAAGDQQEVQRQVGGAIFLSVVLGAFLSLVIGLGSRNLLLAVGSVYSLSFSLPYLLCRLPGVVPSTISSAAFSSLQGVKDTVTPLIISIASCITNAVCNYLLMFPLGLGIAGAALATAMSQIVASAAFLAILLRRRLVRWGTVLRPPSREMLAKLSGSIGAAQVRNIAFNVAFVAITKKTQSLDTTGVAASAHAVSSSLWNFVAVILFGLGSSANILTSAELGKKDSTPEAARAIAKRILAWGGLLGIIVGALQVLGLPLLRIFTQSPEVRKAARVPSMFGAALQPINGVVFVGEGLMQATGAFSMLAIGQVISTACFLLSLKYAPASLSGVWMSFWVFNTIRLANVVKFFWFTDSQLTVKEDTNKAHASASQY